MALVQRWVVCIYTYFCSLLYGLVWISGQAGALYVCLQMVTWTGDNWFELSSKLDTIPKGGVKENRYPYDMWNLYPFCMDVLRIWCIVVDFVLWCISGWCGQHIWSHCIWMLLFGATKPGFDVFLAYFNRLVSFLQSMMLVRFYSVCQHVVLMEEVVLFRIWHVKRFFT